MDPSSELSKAPASSINEDKRANVRPEHGGKRDRVTGSKPSAGPASASEPNVRDGEQRLPSSGLTARDATVASRERLAIANKSRACSASGGGGLGAAHNDGNEAKTDSSGCCTNAGGSEAPNSDGDKVQDKDSASHVKSEGSNASNNDDFKDKGCVPRSSAGGNKASNNDNVTDEGCVPRSSAGGSKASNGGRRNRVGDPGSAARDDEGGNKAGSDDEAAGRAKSDEDREKQEVGDGNETSGTNANDGELSWKPNVPTLETLPDSSADKSEDIPLKPNGGDSSRDAPTTHNTYKKMCGAFECQYCSYKWKSAHAWSLHESGTSGEDLGQMCQYCADRAWMPRKVYTLPYDVRVKYRQIYNCSQCKWDWSRAQNLEDFDEICPKCSGPDGQLPYKTETKCIGKFRCLKCSKRWKSSRSWGNGGQTCRSCSDHQPILPQSVQIKFWKQFECSACEWQWESRTVTEAEGDLCPTCNFFLIPGQVQTHVLPYQVANVIISGMFQCPGCKRKWKSATPWDEKGQYCVPCFERNRNVYQLPIRFIGREKNANSRRGGGKHMMDMCQMCQRLGRSCIHVATV